MLKRRHFLAQFLPTLTAAGLHGFLPINRAQAQADYPATVLATPGISQRVMNAAALTVYVQSETRKWAEAMRHSGARLDKRAARCLHETNTVRQWRAPGSLSTCRTG